MITPRVLLGRQLPARVVGVSCIGPITRQADSAESLLAPKCNRLLPQLISVRLDLRLSVAVASSVGVALSKLVDHVFLEGARRHHLGADAHATEEVDDLDLLDEHKKTTPELTAPDSCSFVSGIRSPKINPELAAIAEKAGGE